MSQLSEQSSAAPEESVIRQAWKNKSASLFFRVNTTPANAVWRSFFEYQESPDFAKEAHKRAESYERDVSSLTRSLLASEVRAIFIKPSLLDDTAVPVSLEFQLRA
jgi:hypothetical protein